MVGKLMVLLQEVEVVELMHRDLIFLEVQEEQEEQVLQIVFQEVQLLTQVVEEVELMQDMVLLMVVEQAEQEVVEQEMQEVLHQELQEQSVHADKLVQYSSQLVKAVGVFKLPQTAGMNVAHISKAR